MIPFVDIHTHHIPEGNPQHIVSIVSVDPDATPLNPELRYSIGIHPYNIENKDFQVVISESEKKQVLAIGECGIDHRVPTPIDLQKGLFKAHARLAEKVGKPLIIHQVRSQDEILSAHSDIRPEVPWIIHGFRGKKEQAMQFLKKGFYLSFGDHYNPASLLACPPSHLFLETDDTVHDIRHIYENASQTLSIPCEQLKKIIRENYHNVFLRTIC